MNKEIEIPEGYEARIEGNKVILEPKESEDEKIRRDISDYFKSMKLSSDAKQPMLDSWIAWLEKQKEQKLLSTEETELNSIAFLEQIGYTCIPKESKLHNSHNGSDFEKAINDLRTVACLFANWKNEPSRTSNDGKLIIDADTVETIIKANRVIQESDVFDWDQAYCKGLDHGEIAGYNKAIKKQKPAMVQWTGSNLKEVIDFTGKSPKFDEWFKSWDDYENYVHSHNDILKLFCADGSYYEVPVGAWIVKTPDGYNVASKAVFRQKPEEVDESTKRLIDN